MGCMAMSYLTDVDVNEKVYLGVKYGHCLAQLLTVITEKERGRFGGWGTEKETEIKGNVSSISMS